MIEEENSIGTQAERTATTSSYRSIFKATSLFGGVQVYQILIGVIRSKFIAILLGPAGMGVQGLYQSTVDLVKSLTSFGLDQSAVRDISEANESGNLEQISHTVAIVRRLVWLTGTLGFLLTLVFSPLLSKMTFGNNDYTWGFALLSITLLINQLCAGQKVVLQGMRRLKDLAKASAIGSTIGLLASIPLYYWLGVKGIVPTMIIVSVTAMIISWYYSNRVVVNKKSINTLPALKEGRSMIKMGIAMSISNILVMFFAYILRWFIRKQGGIEEVGLFTAGFVIINSYVGMVFTAMSTDYYPRLAAVNKDNNRCREVINQQGEIALLLLAPIIISCIILMPILIRIVYSNDFLPAGDFLLIAVLGMMFKAGSWVISYSFLAKAESRLFIINEFVTNVYSLAFNLIGYRIGGLQGLGASFLFTYFVYFIQVYIIAHNRYSFVFSSSFKKILFVQLLIVVASFSVVRLIHGGWMYLPLSILFITSSTFSILELDKRLGLKAIVKRFLNSSTTR